MGRYQVQVLPNGLIRVHDRRSGLWGCFTPTGERRGGDLDYSPEMFTFSAETNEIFVG
jgi:hypothetical protein